MGPEGAQLYINPETTPYLLAEGFQIDERYLNKPDDVKRVMQQAQDQQNAMMLAGMANGEAPQTNG